MKKDRLSIHVDNGQSDILEAITVLRNGGTPSQSGLVGITNKTYTSSPILPETIFNVQATGDLEARFSSLNYGGRTKVELLGNGNEPVSGMVISYQVEGTQGMSYELARLGVNTSDPNMGKETSFLVHQQGTVAIGDIRSRSNDGPSYVELANVDAKSALIISASGNASRSGTIALREQANAPNTSANFGKLYVKPYEVGIQTQALFFSDDAGNEFNLANSMEDSKDGALYGNQHGNTFGGWYTPREREESNQVQRNTFLGHGIDVWLNPYTAVRDNTIIGYHAGSGIDTGNKNTVVGSKSLTQSSPSNGNVVVGCNNLTVSDPEDPSRDEINNSIIIGNDLFVDHSTQDFTLAIGQAGTPFVTGLLKGANRKFSIISTTAEKTEFTLEDGDYNFNTVHETENFRRIVTFGSQDERAIHQARSMMSMRFKNASGRSQTLVDYDPSGTIPISPTWENPTFKRPTVSISGDLRLLGDVRFNDGTSLNTSSAFRTYYGLEVSGIKRLFIGTSYYLGLDFDGMNLASSLTSPISPSHSFVAVDVGDNKVGKMDLLSLGAYITSGVANMSDNCNAVFTNADNVIQTTKNSNSVFFGCDVATGATGWKHGIFIGTNAGFHSTTSNPGLSSDTTCTYIGYMAGHTASNTNDAIFIGNSAGKNADSSNKSIFIGLGAGENSTNPNSIGVGAHALGGEISEAEGGSRNIEIVAGLDDNQRLLYTSGALSDTINIQNSIAGNTKTPSISIGKATLTPDAVLEVIRDTTDTSYSLGHTDDNIQKWINNDSGVARVNSSGSYIKSEGCDSWFGNHEGFMTEYIYGPSSFTSPTSGLMRVRSYEKGFGTDKVLYVTNRDATVDIHGPGAVGGAAYVVTIMVNGEHRPIYVSCSGAS
jgi:hypothetical protein